MGADVAELVQRAEANGEEQRHKKQRVPSPPRAGEEARCQCGRVYRRPKPP